VSTPNSQHPTSRTDVSGRSNSGSWVLDLAVEICSRGTRDWTIGPDHLANDAAPVGRTNRHRLAAGLFEAVAHFRNSRLPEALGGHGREETPIPTAYPRSNAPQAWSASAMVQLVQTLLGIYPFAPAHVLALVRPHLPQWLPAVTVRNVRVGTATASIRFERGRDGAAFDVFDKRGMLFVVEMPPPQATEVPTPNLQLPNSWELVAGSWEFSARQQRARGHYPSEPRARRRSDRGS
jgi:hypothetical protein